MVNQGGWRTALVNASINCDLASKAVCLPASVMPCILPASNNKFSVVVSVDVPGIKQLYLHRSKLYQDSGNFIAELNLNPAISAKQVTTQN
jgi:hypothetical protein